MVAVTPILLCLDAEVGRGGTLDVPIRGSSLIASSPENGTIVVVIVIFVVVLVIVALNFPAAAVDG